MYCFFQGYRSLFPVLCVPFFFVAVEKWVFLENVLQQLWVLIASSSPRSGCYCCLLSLPVLILCSLCPSQCVTSDFYPLSINLGSLRKVTELEAVCNSAPAFTWCLPLTQPEVSSLLGPCPVPLVHSCNLPDHKEGGGPLRPSCSQNHPGKCLDSCQSISCPNKYCNLS